MMGCRIAGTLGFGGGPAILSPFGLLGRQDWRKAKAIKDISACRCGGDTLHAAAARVKSPWSITARK